ncbi:helix-turn-helix domain-containing protein [Sphingomonas sp. GC_Shp_3]|uniref:winged helix-turn-helix transcriptional regulator n=1 Tax=Sphingomonas sp. GC_Shp_3 TaxID=2937383 RepID=UPI00226A297C|nr:helix-turn-helix domain-containing protein [Sphingomonas sp. GC_Shp_3]
MDVTETLDEAVPTAREARSCLKVTQVLSRVGDKWTVLVIIMLRERPYRFNELKRGIDGISQRMLTLTLRNMERDGLVTRTVTPSIPPRVDYELTEVGTSLAGPVKILGDWAFRNLKHIAISQAAYDARNDPPRSPAPTP